MVASDAYRTAVHEAAHGIVCHVLFPGSFKCIVARPIPGWTQLGVMVHEAHQLTTHLDIHCELAMFMAGKVGEELLLGTCDEEMLADDFAGLSDLASRYLAHLSLEERPSIEQLVERVSGTARATLRDQWDLFRATALVLHLNKHTLNAAQFEVLVRDYGR